MLHRVLVVRYLSTSHGHYCAGYEDQIAVKLDNFEWSSWLRLQVVFGATAEPRHDTLSLRHGSSSLYVFHSFRQVAHTARAYVPRVQAGA